VSATGIARILQPRSQSRKGVNETLHLCDECLGAFRVPIDDLFLRFADSKIRQRAFVSPDKSENGRSGNYCRSTAPARKGDCRGHAIITIPGKANTVTHAPLSQSDPFQQMRPAMAAAWRIGYGRLSLASTNRCVQNPSSPSVGEPACEPRYRVLGNRLCLIVSSPLSHLDEHGLRCTVCRGLFLPWVVTEAGRDFVAARLEWSTGALIAVFPFAIALS